jgi:transcriptional accessory protein Tex/SPT6
MDRNLSPEKQEGQGFIKRPTKYINYKENRRYKEQVFRKKGKEKYQQWSHRPMGDGDDPIFHDNNIFNYDRNVKVDSKLNLLS